MRSAIEKAMREAGSVVRNAHKASMQERTKTNSKDFVTRYDVQVQEMLFSAIERAVAGITLIGEEMERFSPSFDKPFCIVDPIDGTANFVKGVKRSCISVAIGQSNAIEHGFVYDPYLDELFSAELGKGAFLNGAELVRDNTIDLASSLVCLGTCPYDPALASMTFFAAETMFRKSLDVRRTGTAALDLCYTAANRFDLFFEASLSPWDHAAGTLIAREAGGRACAFDGAAPSLETTSSIVSGSAAAVDEFLRMVADGEIF